MTTAIWEIPDKKASTIVEHLGSVDFSDDPYHRCIVLAANKLVKIGLVNYVYDTQYSSGTTVWHCNGFSPITVKPNGTVF